MAAVRISLWKFGGLTPITLAKRTVGEISKDDIAGHSAELSYYFLLALFPALLFMMTLLGFMAGPGSELRNQLMAYMAKGMPGSAGDLVEKTLNEISESATGLKAVLSAAGALWAATGGIDAISKTLNIAYNVQETRSWVKRKIVSAGLTIGLAVLIIVALGVLAFGGKIGEVIASQVGLGSVFTVTWKFLQLPIALGAMFLSFSMMYYFAPNMKNPQWYWISPGAAVGVLLWVIASSAFSAYLRFFNTYSKTYGSLGAVIILMLWLYITGMSILIGGEVNSEITRADHERQIYERKLRQVEFETAA
jgi:membrane protein